MQVERKRNSKDRNPSKPYEIEMLIELVRRNPTLYNYKQDRRRADVNRGWQRVAHQMGEKYTIEECRRKWKNLRDTYHQYRLRKPKESDGLKNWRFAKALSFLSDIYQPKLKSERAKYVQLQSTHFEINADNDKPTNISYLSDDFEIGPSTEDDGFTLEEEDMSTTNKEAENNMEMKLCTDEENQIDDVNENIIQENEDDDIIIEQNQIKDESINSIIMNGDSGEIDYEDVGCEVVDCEEVGGESTKNFRLTDAKGFQISEVVSQVMLNDSTTPSIEQEQQLIKPIHTDYIEQNDNHQYELDLFFAFLKTKMLRLSPVNITAIQLEFLNCVLKYEAENAQNKNDILV